jgi:hypothetical protein
MGMNYSPKKGEVTKYTKNGEDILSSLSKSEREIEYVDHLSGNSNDFNPDETGKNLVLQFPFSSIGLSVGFRYSF